MSNTVLRYHVPLLGHVAANLHEESERIYLSLASSGEIDRLKRLDHLGVMRFAWEGAHHSRWEYTVVILSLIERCKSVPQVHLASGAQLAGSRLSSGYEALKAWALLLNTGHLVWTFAAERALMMETWANSTNGSDPYLSSIKRPAVRAFAEDVLRNGRVQRFFQALAFLRVPGLIGEAPDRELCRDVLEAYVAQTPRTEQVARLRRIYVNLRRLAYMALDTHYTPSVVAVDLTQVLTDGDTLARFALRDPTRTSDELDALGTYLDRETYLGRGVMEAMAAREAPLRQLIRASLRTTSFRTTLESLASGSLQDRVVPLPARSVSRVSGDAAGGIAGYWPGRGNARVEQAKLDAELPQRTSAVALYWNAAGGSDWVLQSHTRSDSPQAVVSAFFPVWRRATDAHARASASASPRRWPDAYSERLASTLLLQVLPLFFGQELRWEWGVPSTWGEAVLVPRRSARWILEREISQGRASLARQDELRMLARTLRRRPLDYVSVSMAPLIAYRDALPVAELDGCFVECEPLSLRLTLVEAKRMNSGSKTKAERALGRSVSRLGVNSGTSQGPLSSEALAGGLARAWVVLQIVS